jgi:hypothetical protein
VIHDVDLPLRYNSQTLQADPLSDTPLQSQALENSHANSRIQITNPCPTGVSDRHPSPAASTKFIIAIRRVGTVILPA